MKGGTIQVEAPVSRHDQTIGGVQNSVLFRTAAASVLGLAVLSVAKAEGNDPPAGSPPVFTALRYDEDYSYLKDPADRTDAFDPIKYIPLTESGESYLSLGGQVRDRYEYFQNYNFGSGPQDPNGYNLVRVLLNADLHLGPHVRVFVQGISATEQGRVGGPRSSDENEFGLQQAFVDFMLPLGADAGLTLRGGRQVIAFGDQRLIGVSDWTNVRRTFDGARATLTSPGNTLDVFYARPVNVKPYEFDDDVPGTYIAGVYDTWKPHGVWEAAQPAVEAYALYVQRENMTYNTTAATEQRFTLGTRLTANPRPFDFDVEGDYQFGRFNDQATHSFSVAVIGGYTFENALLMPRVFLGSDIASGGQNNNPGNTFDQLFPSGHDQFGIIDEIGRQDIIDVHPGVTFTLLQNKRGAQNVTLLTQYRQFWRESAQDAVYNSSGSVVRAANGSTARGIGGELDFQLNWQFTRHLSGYAGYCHFFPGAFIAATGPDKPIDFAYWALTFTF